MGSLHNDQRGSMSIVSVFAVMFLAMLLGMVMNAGRHVDGKIRMQNAADSAAYSGGVVLARGMNTIAFTNHLLCNVFAVTAFLREARDQNSASYTPKILAAWSRVAPVFSSSGFPKFTALGSAIQQKVPLEQRMVDRYSAWAKSVSDQVLPLMEQILSEELIPQYQRAVVAAFPDIAQSAARKTAAQNGSPDHGRGTMYGVLWRTDGRPLGGGDEAGYSPDDRTLPIVDPELDEMPNQQAYVDESKAERTMLAHRYLDEWNNLMLRGFDRYAKMSQFAGLWRSFTCGYLERLLNEEYPRTNLPMIIREDPGRTVDPTAALEKNYTFVSVVYWKKLPETLPGLFRNPLEPDAQAFAEVHVFVPLERLGWVHIVPSGGASDDVLLGGVPGEDAAIGGDSSGQSGPSGPGEWRVGRVGGTWPWNFLQEQWWTLMRKLGTSPLASDTPPQWNSTPWNLLNQSWNCQLAPVTAPALIKILQTDPQLPGFDEQNFTLPNLGGLRSEDLQQISPH